MSDRISIPALRSQLRDRHYPDLTKDELLALVEAVEAARPVIDALANGDVFKTQLIGAAAATLARFDFGGQA